MGFDVWLGNNRGNKYCLNHVKLSEKENTFWKFSFHEMGVYDLPAIIDYIRGITHIGKLTLIAHSQGTTQAFAGMSIMPDYFSNVLNGFLALGPVAHLENLPDGCFKTMSNMYVDKILVRIGFDKDIMSFDSNHSSTQKEICKKFHCLCDLFMKISDEDSLGNDRKRLSVFLSHYPAGSSVQALHHFAEIIRNKKFADLEGNSYNLERIYGIPIALFIGDKDNMSTLDDNLILRKRLGNNVMMYVNFKGMGHSTFMISNDDILSEYVLKFMDKLYHKTIVKYLN
jgi:lysosomal acid lipase/cholesteryl ester hydrolase